MDFALIMFVALLVTGTIWLADIFITRPKRELLAKGYERSGNHTKEQITAARKEPIIIEYARAFFPVILIVFLLRSFLVEPFRIPSGSMLPSLLPGDFILVNKFIYGIRLPVINKKVLDINQPERGNVMVFRYPGDPSVNYIKRVVGLPGDHIVYKNKQLYINDQLMPQTNAQPYTLRELGGGKSMMERRQEDLTGAVHNILISKPTRMLTMENALPDNYLQNHYIPDQYYEYEVPSGKYFVMGDNRDRSNDSRFWGFVPEENLVGNAFFIWFSWDMARQNGWFWQKIVWSRIGNVIN